MFHAPALLDESPLRRFISLQRDTLLILGSRRIPPLPCPASNTNSAISIVTAMGFGSLESSDYVKAVRKLQPDILLGMGDVIIGQKVGSKRMEKMGDRTLAWIKEMVVGISDEGEGLNRTALFAPILPIESEQQSYYLDDLQDELQEHLAGLVLYEARSILAIPKNLINLPRLLIGEPESPHKVLDGIWLGIDMFSVPFIYTATDAGIALDFSFPPKQATKANDLIPLGVDMWSPVHAVDLSPLRMGCQCYTCTSHHRAYVQHLLGAKEMLAWVLLQLHNHQVMDDFFTGVRRSLDEGSFDHDKTIFAKMYENGLPAKTGQGPRYSTIYLYVCQHIKRSHTSRVRGYQFKSEGKGEPRKNPPAYRMLDEDKEKIEDATLPSPSLNSQNLEEQGFAERVT